MLFRFLPILIAALLISCSGENEKPSTNVDVDLKGQTGECLSQLGTKLSAYINQELSEAQVKEIWHCLNGAVDDFVEITSPEHPRGYPPEALARFFERFFLKRDIPTPVAEALMNLKRILVGGEKEFLTNEEISKLKVIIQKAEGWSIRLNPHLNALFLKDPTSLSYSKIENAFGELSQVSFEIGLWLEEQGQGYSQTEVRELLLSLQGWIDTDLRKEAIGTFVESLPTFFKLKSLLIGGTDHQIRATEWPLFLRKAVSVLSLVQTLNLKMQRDRLTDLLHDESLKGLLTDVKTLLSGVNTPYRNFDHLIKEASRLSWWPNGVPADGLSGALLFFFQKFLGIDEGRSSLIIDHRVTDRLQKLIDSYQSYLSGSDAQFESMLNKVGPVFTNERGMIHFERLQAEPRHSVRRNQLSAIYLFINQLSKAYGVEEFDRESFHTVFADVLEVLKEMDVLTSIEPSYAGRLFREANVFTLVSDGNASVSTGEMSVYAWMVLSAFNQQQWIMPQISKSCRNSKTCIFDQWTKNSATFLTNFPRLNEFLNTLPDDQRIGFLEVARKVCGSDSLIMNIVILSYLESFMIRYDVDQSSILNTAEVVKSYEVFGLTLEELLGGIVPSEDILEFFTYLFKYGSTPLDPDAHGAWLRYFNWKLFPDRWDIAADRVRLLQILSELSKL